MSPQPFIFPLLNQATLSSKPIRLPNTTETLNPACNPRTFECIPFSVFLAIYSMQPALAVPKNFGYYKPRNLTLLEHSFRSLSPEACRRSKPSGQSNQQPTYSPLPPDCTLRSPLSHPLSHRAIRTYTTYPTPERALYHPLQSFAPPGSYLSHANPLPPWLHPGQTTQTTQDLHCNRRPPCTALPCMC